MSWIAIILIFLAFIAIMLLKRLHGLGTGETEYPYRKLDYLFTPAERSFLGVLGQAAGEHAHIFGKVRVADVITPKKGMSRSEWQKSFNKISGKHFDFLLCAKNDLSVLCAIELNDRSHNSEKRKDRDELLEGACRSANLPLIQVTAKASYTLQEVRQSIAAYLPDRAADDIDYASKGSSAEQPHQVADKSCPRCSSAMVKKTAKKGKNIGNEFWACSGFPKCRHIEKIPA